MCSVPSPSGCLRATSEFLFLGTQGAAADESGGGSAVRCNPMTTIEQAVCTGVRNLRACTQGFPTPYPPRAALQGCTAVALIVEHDDARHANRHCTSACGALTRVRSACLWRAQRAVPTSTDPMGILKSTREFKAVGAGKEHTSAVRGGGRDPVVRRPGSGLGRLTARSKFFRAAMHRPDHCPCLCVPRIHCENPRAYPGRRVKGCPEILDSCHARLSVG